MHEAALKEFWDQFQLPSLPSPGTDVSIEVEGAGRVEIRRFGEDIAMTCFLDQGPDRQKSLHQVLEITDYRKSPTEGLHPVLSEDGKSGFLTVIRSKGVTTPKLMAAFEMMLALQGQLG